MTVEDFKELIKTEGGKDTDCFIVTNGNGIGYDFEVVYDDETIYLNIKGDKEDSLEKLGKIEEIVNRELIAGKHNYQTCYQAFFEIADIVHK